MNDLDGIFTSVLNMSITASYGILIILLVRLLLRKAPRIFAYSLWAVILFRLLCPFSIPSSVSLLGLLDLDKAIQTTHLEYIPDNLGYMTTPKIHSGLTVIDKALSGSMPAAPPYGSINPMQVWLFLGNLIWLLGILALLVYSAFSYGRIKRSLRTATLLEGNIYESEWVDTAFVCGIIRPKIYIPLGLDPAYRDYILRHEKIHIQRYDYLIKPLAYIALVIHWFNPFVWLAFSLMNKDMEMSCDERVLKEMNPASKEPYSYALLALSTEGKKRSLVSPLAFGESHVKSRIKNVLRFQPPSRNFMIVAVLGVILLSALLIANPTKPVLLKDEPQKAMAKELMANKTEYIGNNSKVSALIHTLPLPKGISYKSMELLTREEPYALIIRLTTETPAEAPDLLKSNEIVFQDYSALLLSLIGNGSIIEWHLDDESSKPQKIVFTRETLNKAYGQELRTFSKDETALIAFLNTLPTTDNLHIQALQSDGFYQINRQREVLALFDKPSQKDLKFMDEVIFDFMVKSAAWPGIDVDQLDSYVLLRRQGTDYYIFKMNGKACIQTRKDGYYSILSEQLYKAILARLN